MSKIIDVRVDWREGWANMPRIEVLFDKLPENEDLRYRKKGFNYLAVDDGGYASFWSCNVDAGNNGGCSGRSFPIIMIGGREVILHGPWSNSSDRINKEFPLAKVVEANCTDDPKCWEKGYTFYSAAVSIKALVEFVQEHPVGFGLALVKNFCPDGVFVQPTREGALKDSKDQIIEMLV